jgi:hypothetical protein
MSTNLWRGQCSNQSVTSGTYYFYLPRLYLLLRVVTGFVSKVGGLYCVLFLSLMIQVLLCSCLRVILDQLDTLTRPEVNANLHELGFQLMYELCVDPVTCGPMVELLWGEKYEFFSKHLDTFVCEPLPKRSVNLPMRVSSLQQVFWFFGWTLSISICVQFDEQ